MEERARDRNAERESRQNERAEVREKERQRESSKKEKPKNEPWLIREEQGRLYSKVPVRQKRGRSEGGGNRGEDFGGEAGGRLT